MLCVYSEGDLKARNVFKLGTAAVAGFSGQLEAQTTNGQVQSAFPISVPAGNPPLRLVGPLGDGGDTRVILRTVNGNVSLRRQ
jgi:hypothetical protein